jgi:hypothetical protein
MALQGAVVVLIGDSHPSPFFLIDYLPYVLAEVDQLFSLPSTTPVFLFGHSQGGGGVARVLTDEDLPASDPRQKVRARVVGGLLLAPTFGGVELHMNVAPSLVIYGALDTDGPAFRVQCTNSTKYSPFLLSPVRLYQNARSAFNALLLVDGATHFRWIQAHDDVGKVSNIESEREQNLILDGPDDSRPAGTVYRYHDLILRSYATYFYRMLALNQPDYEQCFVNPEFQIPELSVSTAPSKVVNQIHRYASSRLLTSLNRTSDVRKTYRVCNMVVTREVVANGVEQTSENGGLHATSTLDVDQLRSLPFFNLDLIVVEGTSIDVSFKISPGLRIGTVDVLYAQVSVLSPDASLYDGKVDVHCEITFGNGGTAEMPVMEESLRRRDVLLSQTQLESTGGETDEELGDMHTVVEMHVPVAWFLQECYGTVTDTGEATMTTLRLTIMAGDRIRFGLGHLGIFRLINDGRMFT